MKFLLKSFLFLFLIINCIFAFSCADKTKGEESFHIHSFVNIKQDAESHWYECDCGEIRGKEKHVYFEYVCSCGLQTYSSKLTFEKNADGQSYSVSSFESGDEMVFIPTAYNLLPVTTISVGAFKDNKSIKKIVISNGVKFIQDGAFAGCESLEKIELPESLEKIANGVFENCKNLKEIDFPKNLNSLGERALINCESLLKISFDRNLSYIGEQAFLGCKSLLKFEVEKHNEEFKSVNGNLYSKDLKVLICFANGKNQTNFTIPKGTEKINDYAFYGNENLITLNFPKSVIEIGHKAFYITNLQAINYTALKTDWEKINFDGEWLFSKNSVTVYSNGEEFIL